MAKKNVELNQVPAKSIDEMSDVEFITSADYLASPYYRAYMSAKARVNSNDYAGFQPMTSAFQQPRQNRDVVKNVSKKSVKGAGYSKKRGFAIFIIALFMLIIIAVAVVSVLNISSIAGYTATYIKPGVTVDTNVNIGLLDPIFGLVKKFVTVNLDSFYFDNYLSNIATTTDLMTKIALYAVPAAAVLIVLCAVIGFIKAIGALFAKKRSNKLFKKYKFGFLSLVMFLCGAIMLVGGIFASGLEIKEILNFIMQKTTVLYAGYGLYAIVVLPLLSLILSCVCYKKVK